MNDTNRRILAYGATALVGGALVYGGFVYEADADVMTLLGSVDIKLQLASSMPAVDKSGQPVALRQELIAESLDQLGLVEQQEPGNPSTESCLAFIDYLEGRYVEAAVRYESLRALDGCGAELREQSILNQARMLRLSGSDAQARVLLVDAVGSLSEVYSEAAKRELASIERSADGRADSVHEAAAPADSGR